MLRPESSQHRMHLIRRLASSVVNGCNKVCPTASTTGLDNNSVVVAIAGAVLLEVIEVLAVDGWVIPDSSSLALGCICRRGLEVVGGSPLETCRLKLEATLLLLHRNR